VPLDCRLVYSHFVWRLVIVLAFLTASCGWRPGSYPPPAQRSLDLGTDPGGVGPFVQMENPLADDYVVRDFMPDHGVLRWAFVHPELRFRVKDAGNLKFEMEFAIPEVTFRVTGPVTVSCAVNGKHLGSIRCNHAGDYRMVNPVPDGLVQPDQYIHVTFEATPRWVSPEDGAQLSFLLRSAGFTQ